jgi:hypothetical protein
LATAQIRAFAICIPWHTARQQPASPKWLCPLAWSCFITRSKTHRNGESDDEKRENGLANFPLELTRGPFLGTGNQLHFVTPAASRFFRLRRRARQPSCRGRPALGARAQLSVGVRRIAQDALELWHPPRRSTTFRGVTRSAVCHRCRGLRRWPTLSQDIVYQHQKTIKRLLSVIRCASSYHHRI